MTTAIERLQSMASRTLLWSLLAITSTQDAVVTSRRWEITGGGTRTATLFFLAGTNARALHRHRTTVRTPHTAGILPPTTPQHAVRPFVRRRCRHRRRRRLYRSVSRRRVARSHRAYT